MLKRKKKILWFARGGGIAKMGPFLSQVEASKALRLCTKDVHAFLEINRGPASRELFPPDAFVWPEEEE